MCGVHNILEKVVSKGESEQGAVIHLGPEYRHPLSSSGDRLKSKKGQYFSTWRIVKLPQEIMEAESITGVKKGSGRFMAHMTIVSY